MRGFNEREEKNQEEDQSSSCFQESSQSADIGSETSGVAHQQIHRKTGEE
jgi:hypothetical protein